jgi:hypothetical protein
LSAGSRKHRPATPENRPNAGVWLVRNRNGSVTFVENRIDGVFAIFLWGEKDAEGGCQAPVRFSQARRDVSVFPGKMDYFFNVFRGISMTSGRG